MLKENFEKACDIQAEISSLKHQQANLETVLSSEESDLFLVIHSGQGRADANVLLTHIGIPQIKELLYSSLQTKLEAKEKEFYEL